MPLGLILGLGRAMRRTRTSSLDILSSKRAPMNYYKGKNCIPTGFHTRKGLRLHERGQISSVSASSLIPSAYTTADIAAGGVCKVMHFSRFSNVAANSKEISCESTENSCESTKEISCELDLMSFIRSIFDLAEGPYHYWINRTEVKKEFLKEDAAYLILAEAFLDEPPGSWGNRIVLLEKVKQLQQRYPWLQVIGFQSCSSVSSVADRNRLTNVIMEEYISFPILLCSKNFSEVASGACCIFLKDSKSLPLFNENDVDLGILHEAITDLNKQLVKNAEKVDKLRSPWSKKPESFMKPYICSYLHNLPLSLPACISADAHGKRFFLSDTNHHRVIVFDSTGNILDAIGSSPGHEDGDFENAKLMRPAASWYDAEKDCLYLVDSENHAIRRADLGSRVLETLYPSCADESETESGVWSWILDKLGFSKKLEKESDEFDEASLLFPWHLLKSTDNNLLVMNKSFETLWVMDLEGEAVHDVVKGRESVMEFCGKQIMEKLSELQGLSSDVLQQLSKSNHPFDENHISHSGFLSSFVTAGEDTLICDPVGQRVLKLNKSAETASAVDLSNFGNLGLPYWLSFSLDRVYPWGYKYEEALFDRIQLLNPLPGTIDVHMAIDIPKNTELVEPLQEGCVWRQAKGGARVQLDTDTETVTEKKDWLKDWFGMGSTQSWYDEMDNSIISWEAEPITEEDQPRVFEDGKVHIDCVIRTIPGTSEVTVSAPLYLRLQSSSNTCKDTQDTKAAKIADILKPERYGRLQRDTFIRLLLNLDQDLGDLVFIKPLHVKMILDTLDHPNPENAKDIIFDSKLDIDISL